MHIMLTQALVSLIPDSAYLLGLIGVPLLVPRYGERLAKLIHASYVSGHVHGIRISDPLLRPDFAGRELGRGHRMGPRDRRAHLRVAVRLRAPGGRRFRHAPRTPPEQIRDCAQCENR